MTGALILAGAGAIGFGFILLRILERRGWLTRPRPAVAKHDQVQLTDREREQFAGLAASLRRAPR